MPPGNSPSNSPSVSPSASPSPEPLDTVFIVNTGKVAKRVNGKYYIQIKPNNFSPPNEKPQPQK